MSDDESFEDLTTDASELNQTLGQTSVLVSGFDSELRRMSTSLAATGKDVATLEKGLSRGLRQAFDGVVFDGMKLSDALSTVAQSLSNSAYNAAIKPVTEHFGGLLSQGVTGLVEGILPFANGAPFSSGRVMPFADGGVISQATHFGMRGGMGVMGEAGPEAIMPLARGADGKLGVRAGGGGGGNNVVVNISTPDVAGFQRSRGQIAAQMSRALSAGQRNQ
ncbi:phage tail tape measure protein [Sulfitobacter donghicola]|uniref:Tail protein n=1 Tax=Sulfitobacter donghicola DSW-25 = KCTC 12864 = JCM 14565 TaxID=1300350 RepID=A0A073IKV4_9RHOB|nr:phage tail tape measure protein [Sulfitobacter donghicola]KEJ90210.1 tail protein [Sulfitobacter donghicola DSW-25 = KCTC 12864 = JCM 14565]KIN66622.1 putative phage tail minor protein [Sulfitobacter donghicola DSW-25 = KCTC 12864 = JCM 14565]